MKLIQSPNIFIPESIEDYAKTLFLSGGISGCEVWQDRAVDLLSGTDFIVLNPRRKDFDIYDKKMAIAQIEWEYWHLKLANTKLFWFPAATLCPITLFELGKHLHDKHVYIGAENDYQRRLDLLVQQSLARTELRNVFTNTLEDLIRWLKEDECNIINHWVKKIQTKTQ